MMFMGMAPLDALLAGWLAGKIGAPATVAFGRRVLRRRGGGVRREAPKLRQQARELIIAQQMAAGTPPEQLTQPVAVVAVPEEQGGAAGVERRAGALRHLACTPRVEGGVCAVDALRAGRGRDHGAKAPSSGPKRRRRRRRRTGGSTRSINRRGSSGSTGRTPRTPSSARRGSLGGGPVR